MSAPALSVVVVVFAGGNAPARVLAALAPQVVGEDVEVIVTHASGTVDVGMLAERLPAVRSVEAPAHTPPARLRALGVRAATGRIIACTEDHCVPSPDWCARILAAHASERGVIGGAIDKLSPARASAWAAYLLDYSRYMSPLPAGPAEYLSDCNVSYDRAILASIDDVWRDEFHETSVNWALAKCGHTLRADPTIVVRQDRPVTFGAYLRERMEHGRTFAGTRVEGASAAARAVWTLKSIALPAVILARTVRRLVDKKALGQVPSGAWLTLAAAAVAWSGGELAGYVTGRDRR